MTDGFASERSLTGVGWRWRHVTVPRMASPGSAFAQYVTDNAPSAGQCSSRTQGQCLYLSLRRIGVSPRRISFAPEGDGQYSTTGEATTPTM